MVSFDIRDDVLKRIEGEVDVFSQEIYIPEGVKIIDEYASDYLKRKKMFFNVHLPSSLQAIKAHAFKDSMVEEIILPKMNRLSEIGDEAFAASELQSFPFERAKHLYHIGKSSFACTNLSKIDLFNTNIEMIDDDCFFNLKGTDDVEVILSPITEMICRGAFADSRVVVKDFPSTLKYCFWRSFYGCRNSVIDLSKATNLKIIGEEAFTNSPNLRKVIFDPSADPIDYTPSYYEGASFDSDVIINDGYEDPFADIFN